MFTTKKPETVTPSKAPNPRKPATSSMITNDAQRIADTKEKTIVSKGCFVKGEISGDSDISVFGKVDGLITLKGSILTIEKSGKVKASIFAKIVNVTGKITGNIDANEKIIIHENGSVTGDMTAPKIILKDGSYFKGNVSMTDSKVNSEIAKTGTNKPV